MKSSNQMMANEFWQTPTADPGPPVGLKGHPGLAVLKGLYSGTVNPKDKLGKKKVPLHAVPLSALVEIALALESGAEKYGYMNWRDERISANVYIAACLRHVIAWANGLEVDPSSGLNPLAHALACLAILVDSIHNDCLSDDRCHSEGSLKFLERANNREGVK